MNKILLGIIIGIFVLFGTKVFADNGWVRLSSQEDWTIKTSSGARAMGIRFHDDEKDATCWGTYSDSYLITSSISCLPDKELRK